VTVAVALKLQPPFGLELAIRSPAFLDGLIQHGDQGVEHSFAAGLRWRPL